MDSSGLDRLRSRQQLWSCQPESTSAAPRESGAARISTETVLDGAPAACGSLAADDVDALPACKSARFQAVFAATRRTSGENKNGGNDCRNT